MNNYQYRAWAYVGVYELADLGLHDTEEGALAELQANITAQLVGEPDDDQKDIYLNFWANSKVVPEEVHA